jgi:peptidoglycan/LPS O-acetylase OafA/YrhL
MKSQNQTFEPAFDHLRGFAALLILLYHAFQHISGFMAHGSGFAESDRVSTNNPLFALLLEGHTAVALFIVMSGFLFTRSALGKEVEYRSFIKNRLLRIYPLLMLLVVVELAINTQLTLQNLVFIILPTGYLPSVASMGVVGSMFWAVAVEFQFYLVFPFLIRTLNERGIRPLLAIIAFAILIRYGTTFYGSNIRDVSYWTSLGRIDQFLIGMIAAKLSAEHYSREKGTTWKFAGAAVLIIAVIYGFHRLGGWPVVANWKGIWPTIEGSAWALVIVTYLPVARSVPRFISGIASRIGEISYSTYLLHVSILIIVGMNGWLLRWTGVPKFDAALTVVLVVVPIVLAVSTVSYYAVEKPFLSLRVRYTKPYESPVPDALEQ